MKVCHRYRNVANVLMLLLLLLLCGLGVHDCLVKSVMKADMDLRRVLLSQMVLSGGSTLFPGTHHCHHSSQLQ
jgi:hypothetical protein